MSNTNFVSQQMNILSNHVVTVLTCLVLAARATSSPNKCLCNYLATGTYYILVLLFC